MCCCLWPGLSVLWWFANNHGKATTSSLTMQNVYLVLVLGFKLGNALAMPTGEQDAGVTDSTAHAWGHEDAASAKILVVHGAGWADKITGETVEPDATGFGYTLREPLVSWRLQAAVFSLLKAAFAFLCVA